MVAAGGRRHKQQKSALSAYEQTKHSFIQDRYGTYMKSSKLF